MAGHIKHCLALQGLLKQLEQLAIKGASRNTHTIAASANARTPPAYTLIHHVHGNDLPHLSSVKVCSPLIKTEILDKIKPRTLIETPKLPGVDTTISNPLSTGIKPIDIPTSNKVVIKPPTTNTPISASKNGNMYVLRIKKKKRKRRALEKLRTRMWPVRRKIVFLREKKKEKKIRLELAALETEGAAYDYLEEIKLNLEEAKKRGYRYNMLHNVVLNPVQKEMKKPKEPKEPKRSLKGFLSSMRGETTKEKSE